MTAPNRSNEVSFKAQSSAAILLQWDQSKCLQANTPESEGRLTATVAVAAPACFHWLCFGLNIFYWNGSSISFLIQQNYFGQHVIDSWITEASLVGLNVPAGFEAFQPICYMSSIYMPTHITIRAKRGFF